MRNCLLLALVLLLVLVGATSPTEGVIDVSLNAKLQAVLDREIERHGERGVSAAIVFPDGTLWTGTSGVSHGTVPIAPSMLFAIGSVTKNFVAALALDLAEDGALSLDDSVSDHLPSMEQVDGQITIRQLLNHTSGIYNFFDSDVVWEALKTDTGRVWTPEEVLAYLERPYFEPGEGFRYSNTNYMLVGMIIEKVTGSTLSAELDRRLWTPAGLDIGFFDPDQTSDRMAHVFGDNFQFGAAERDLTHEPRASHESMIYGSGGLFTTAADLARWSQAIFGGEILEEASLDEMLRFVPFRPFANMRSYGLGVQTFERRFSFGVEAIGHGGGNIGSATYMVYLPEQRVSIVAMVNAFPTNAIDDITRGMIRVVLRDMGELGWIPYVPGSLLWLVGTGSLVALLLFLWRRRTS